MKQTKLPHWKLLKLQSFPQSMKPQSLQNKQGRSVLHGNKSNQRPRSAMARPWILFSTESQKIVSIFSEGLYTLGISSSSHGSITLLPESSFGTLRKFRVVICSKAEHEWLTPFRPNRGIIPRKTKKTFHKSIMGISEIVCGFSLGDSRSRLPIYTLKIQSYIFFPGKRASRTNFSHAKS